MGHSMPHKTRILRLCQAIQLSAYHKQPIFSTKQWTCQTSCTNCEETAQWIFVTTFIITSDDLKAPPASSAKLIKKEVHYSHKEKTSIEYKSVNTFHSRLSVVRWLKPGRVLRKPVISWKLCSTRYLSSTTRFAMCVERQLIIPVKDVKKYYPWHTLGTDQTCRYIDNTFLQQEV